MHIKKLAAMSLLCLSPLSAAFGACTNSDLQGSWDIAYHDNSDTVVYCKGVKLTAKGYVKKGVGICEAESVTDGKFTATPSGGRLIMNSNCSLKASPTSPRTIKVYSDAVGGDIVMKITRGRMSTDKQSLLMLGHEDGTVWSGTWHALKAP